MAAGGRWLLEANSEACEVRGQARHAYPKPSSVCVTTRLGVRRAWLAVPRRSLAVEGVDSMKVVIQLIITALNQTLTTSTNASS